MMTVTIVVVTLIIVLKSNIIFKMCTKLSCIFEKGILIA
jgi:hypothetical protein